jgi:hypothetical protein
VAYHPYPNQQYTMRPGRVKYDLLFSAQDARMPQHPAQGLIGPPAGSLEPIRPPPRAPFIYLAPREYQDFASTRPWHHESVSESC